MRSSSLIDGGEFRFERLTITGVDNEPVLARNAPAQRAEEVCLFHKDTSSGDEYVKSLLDRVEAAMAQRQSFPVVRFADGEYEFYKGSLKCNGLYQQAESAAAIRAAFPAHAAALRKLAADGVLAPLIFSGNVRRRCRLCALFGNKDGNDLALRFLAFLMGHGAALTGRNYVPFYAVYAALSVARFAAMLDGKTICIVNSDYNAAACASWFARTGSHPHLVHVPIPSSYIATRWVTMRDSVFANVPDKPNLFLVGAGIGALEVCVDAARRYSVPAIDSGHILNMMNDLEFKSGGPRLFTFSR
jgi:hypothetical protein